MFFFPLSNTDYLQHIYTGKMNQQGEAASYASGSFEQGKDFEKEIKISIRSIYNGLNG